MSRFLWTACILAIKKHQILLTAIPLTGIEWQILMQTVGEAFCFNHRQVILPKKRKFCQYKPVELRKIPCFFWYSIYIFPNTEIDTNKTILQILCAHFVLFRTFYGFCSKFGNFSTKKLKIYIVYSYTKKQITTRNTAKEKRIKQKGGCGMLGWMYDMVWESVFVFSCMIPVLWLWQTVFAGKFSPKLHRSALWIFALYIAGLLAVTGIYNLLLQTPQFAPYFNFELFVDIFSCPEQYLLNILLFVPMGFFAPLLWKTYRKEQNIILLGFVCSLCIELLQMFCGRTTDVDDLLMNTAGALFGYWLFLLAEQKVAFHLLKRQHSKKPPAGVANAFQALACE